MYFTPFWAGLCSSSIFSLLSLSLDANLSFRVWGGLLACRGDREVSLPAAHGPDHGVATYKDAGIILKQRHGEVQMGLSGRRARGGVEFHRVNPKGGLGQLLLLLNQSLTPL